MEDTVRLLRGNHHIKLREYASSAIANMMASSEELCQRALDTGLLDKLQRTLMERLGSIELDRNMACCIMLLSNSHRGRDRDASVGEKATLTVNFAEDHEGRELDRMREEGAVDGGNRSCDSTRADGSTSMTLGECNNKGSRAGKVGEEGTEESEVANGAWRGWSKKQLQCLVWALDHENRDVLLYTVWTVWLLAHEPKMRAQLGGLWAIDGLVAGLRSNAVLPLKEGFLAALWLLVCNEDNCVRVAMRGGLQVLVGVLSFPGEDCYVSLKTLAAGALSQLCSNPDIANLAMHLSLAPALLDTISSVRSTVYLKILSAGLVFCIAKEQKGHFKHFVAQGGDYVLEDMCSAMICSSSSELQACGTFCAASLSLKGRSRRALLSNGGIKGLCRLVRAAHTGEPLKLKVLHALLNLSTERECQPAICTGALMALVDLTRSVVPGQAEFAASILANCGSNPQCRAIMFKEQLARGSMEMRDARVEMERNASNGRQECQPFSELDSGRLVRQRYSAWMQVYLCVSVRVCSQVFAGDRKKSFLGQCNKRVIPGRGISRALSRGQKEDRAWGWGPGQAGDKAWVETGATDWTIPGMVNVRRGMRLPVTSLWQDENKCRARTAPSCLSHQRGTPSGLAEGRDERGELRGEGGGWEKCGGGTLKEWRQGSAAKRLAGEQKEGGQSLAGGLSDVTGAVSSLADYNFGLSYPNPSTVGRPEVGGEDGKKNQQPAPLRGSHRMGPVGALGSVPTPGGENRWKPFVSDCYIKPNILPAWRHRQLPNPGEGMRRRHSQGQVEVSPQEQVSVFNQAVKEHQTVVLLEPPKNYKMVFDGPVRAYQGGGPSSPATLAMFRHSVGASVCESLFEHYIAEDGRCYHLYHTNKLICDVLDPGKYPLPAAPTNLRHVLRKGRTDAKPVLYLPSLRQCPVMEEHYLQLCKIACLQAHGDQPCPRVKCDMFGAMPGDFMVLYVTQEPRAEDGIKEQDAKKEGEWHISNSIFGPRKKEAESKCYVDTDRIIQKALEVDYNRMLKEDRVYKFITKADTGVARGEKTAEESLDEVKAIFAAHYKVFLTAFNYYCVASAQSGRGAFSIQPNQYAKMMQDAQLPDSTISVEEIGKIFVLVNFESDKRSAEAEVNEDRALMRFELMEALLRVAVQKFEEEEQTPAEKVRRVMEDHILAHLPREAVMDSDIFREEQLYTMACDKVFQDHNRALHHVYRKYSLLNPVAGKPFFGLEEWKAFLTDGQLIGESGTQLKVGYREGKQAFYTARMVVRDEMKSRGRITQLSYLDFLEALARLADKMLIPTDKDMARVNVTDVLEYESALSRFHPIDASQDGSLAPSAATAVTSGSAVSKAEPLATKLDRMLRYALGTFAIRCQGVVKAANKGLNLVGIYCTREQIVRGRD
ncbi:unnamed protein product [Discosporangium mesarthrocarpum]